MNQTPHNLEAEHAVLGALLFDPHAAWAGIEDTLSASDFYEPLHRELFEAVVASIRAGQTPDVAALARRFAGSRAFRELGAGGYLVDLVDAADLRRVTPCALEVAETSLRRSIVHVCAEASQAALEDGDVEAVTQVFALERAIAQLSARGPSRAEWSSAGSVVEEAIARSRARSGSETEFPTGLRDVDALLGGFNAGELSILAARPGMGKTTAATAIAKANAAAGRGTLYFSLEMGSVPIGLRLACDVAFERGGVRNSIGPNIGSPTYDRARRNELPDAQWERLEHAQREIVAWPLLLDTRPGLTVSTMEACARRAFREWERKGIEPGPVIVDHLGKVRAEKDRKGSRHAEVADVSAGLAEMAKRLHAPVIALCQLNRGVEGREDKRPVLSDLRQAGEIEEDARQVVFFYRPEYYLRAPDDPLSETAAERAERETKLARARNRLVWIVAKNSHGPLGQVETYCEIACSAIRDAGAIG